MTRPRHLNLDNADAFMDAEVARKYRNRPSYPDDAIRYLASLAVDEPRRALDLGCGTGFIARPLAPLVDHVDAVDRSAAMIDVGRNEPGGGSSRITWIEDTAESVPLSGAYSLIVTGESLHWMEWPVVLPKCAAHLSANGTMAVAGIDTLPAPWEAELREIIARYSVVRDYQPFDLMAALESNGLFRTEGRFESEPHPMPQSVEEYVASFHARSSLASDRMGAEAAGAFDREVADLVDRHCRGQVTRMVKAIVTYGRPLAPVVR